jgi:hypothetical protein
MDADERFQVSAAKILQQFIRKKDGVTLQTIARLVILVYLAANFADTDEGHATIVLAKNTPEKTPAKKLKVGPVAQKLKREGLDIAPADAVNIAGSWRLVTRGLHVKVVQRMTLEQDGKKLYGTSLMHCDQFLFAMS